jgi:acyl-CoA thioester hydrolase
MARTRIELPEKFSFTTTIPVRITDLNYGSHVGNDSILSIIHEARVQFLNHFDLEELKFDGVELIMSDVVIEFKNELFYGDVLTVSVTVAEFSKVAFEIFYKLEKARDGKTVPVAFAKTGMVCFDYVNKKITSVPESAKRKLAIGNEQ